MRGSGGDCSPRPGFLSKDGLPREAVSSPWPEVATQWQERVWEVD